MWSNVWREFFSAALDVADTLRVGGRPCPFVAAQATEEAELAAPKVIGLHFVLEEVIARCGFPAM